MKTLNKKLSAFVVLILVLVVGGYLIVSKKANNVTVSPTPVLFYAPGLKPYIQINFDWSVADSFNIYRAMNSGGPWQKVVSDLPSNAHTAVDYDFPRDARILYYRISSVNKNGTESIPSEAVSLEISTTIPSLASQADISNWRTYSSTEYGIQFKYPPTWDIFEADGTIVVEDSLAGKLSPGKNVYLSFSVSAHGSPAIDEKPVIQMFGDRAGYVYKTAQSIYFPSYDKAGAYIIQIYKQSKGNEVNDILSTFKFTNGHMVAFENAINKVDFTNISKYFADKVFVTLEGSSCCGEIASARAVSEELSRIRGFVFSFDSQDFVVKNYIANIDYQYPSRRLMKNSPLSYFDEYTIGVESDVLQKNKAVVGYKILDGKITDLFIDIGRDRIDSTTNWKTYKDDQNGIEFKYPPDWKVNPQLYRTPAQEVNGEKSSIVGYSIVSLNPKLFKEGYIEIGGRQFNCGSNGLYQTRCVTTNEVGDVHTESNNPEVLKVFDLFTQQFTVIKDYKMN